MNTNSDFNHLEGEQSAHLNLYSKGIVNWYPLGQQALIKAKDENKPIFLSIGYSSSFFCKVMHEQTFSHQETADFLNQHFINIKVDKDELQDLDQYTQLISQITNGQGGWPLNCFMTPDFTPYFLGGYFPRESFNQNKSLLDVAKEMKALFEQKFDEIKENGDKVLDVLKRKPQVNERVEFGETYPSPDAILKAIKSFADEDNGGYGGEPKFAQFTFLEWAIEHMLEGVVSKEYGQHIVNSIEKILMGGIYDHVRGGIHHLSRDAKWLVPNFEKNLHDQAALIKLLAKASLIYPSPLIFDTLVQTLDYLKVEMHSDKGHFFISQGAFSEDIDGLYFCFTLDEFKEVIASNKELNPHLDKISSWFKLSSDGNFERGMNVISLDYNKREDFYKPENWNLLRLAKKTLLESRKLRIPPITDNKGTACSNFNLLSSLVDVIQYCRVEVISRMANEILNQSLESIHKSFVTGGDQESKSRILSSTTSDYDIALFENYVFFSELQLRVYEITGNEIFKKNAKDTIDFIFKEFYADEQFFTRALSFNEHQPYLNIHTPLFDHQYKSALSTLMLILKKWQIEFDFGEHLSKTKYLEEVVTHLSLQNPLAFGEGLRSLVYPNEAYRNITVPKTWLKEVRYQSFFPNFSVRFALNYHDKDNESWEIRTIEGIELQGEGLSEFEQIFKSDNKSQQS